MSGANIFFNNLSTGLERWQLFIGLITIFAVFTNHSIASNVISQKYVFPTPQLEIVKIDGQIYDRIKLNGSPNSGQIGRPSLPARGARILIPYGTDIDQIDLIMGERKLMGTDYHIEPVETPIVLSSRPDNIPELYLEPATYMSDKTVPAVNYENIGIQNFRGYQILILKIHPVEYQPLSGTIHYYTDIEVRVATKPADQLDTSLRGLPIDREEVSKLVDNKTELASYNLPARGANSAFDMLIITSSAFVDAFQPLKDYHDTTGVLTEIHTLDQIGVINPHNIRDYIRDRYLNDGIQYVLIGGDDEMIPALDMYVISWDPPDNVVAYDLPGDIYFSNLDGTFNYDNDALWGETTDGEGGGDIDLFAEVHVGRFCGDTPQEITNLVNKTISYLSRNDQYVEKILLAGEQLGFAGLGEYGGYAMDEMCNFSDAHGFMTYAFPDVVFELTKLYDLTTPPYNHWPASDMINQINSGYHIIDHLGHSGPGYAMRTDTTMLKQQLSNTEYCFVYAEGCSAGEFDRTDCWAEYITAKLPHGAFGCIANARLGLGSRSTRHPVHIFNREFWDAIFDANEAKPQLGRAISDSRADHAYHINDPGIRWNFYEITLFGDPAVAIKPVNSLAISFPEGIPDYARPYSETSFSVRVNGIGEGLPASGTGQVFYAVEYGDPEVISMTEISPGLYEATLPSIICDGVIDFYVGVQENSGQWYYSPEPSDPIRLTTASDTTTLFADDFETDLGWVISGGLWERGIPTGQGGEELQYPAPDPTEGCNGTNVMGYNLDGDYENNLPAAHITSPVIDCSGKDRVALKYYRWLAVEQPIYDQVSILVSNDNVNWTQIWANPAVIADLEWNEMEYDISAVAANQPTVYLRWVMGPTDGGLVYAGWNIDDVKVLAYDCVSYLCGDCNSDESLNVGDAVYLIDYVFKSGSAPEPSCVGDTNKDGAINVGDAVYLINYVFKSGASPEESCCY